MPQPIDRQAVLQLMQEEAQIAEVLPAAEYARDHLPGAISLPLRRLEAEARTTMDPAHAVVVYCWDAA